MRRFSVAILNTSPKRKRGGRSQELGVRDRETRSNATPSRISKRAKPEATRVARVQRQVKRSRRAARAGKVARRAESRSRISNPAASSLPRIPRTNRPAVKKHLARPEQAERAAEVKTRK